MSEQSYVVGVVVEDPRVVTSNGPNVVQASIDCGRDRRVVVEGEVASVETAVGNVVVGVGAGLLRFKAGRKVGVVGQADLAPVRVRVERVTPRGDADRTVVSMNLGPFEFVGYRRSARSSEVPEAEIRLLDGRSARVLFPDNVFAQPGSWLCGSLSHSRKNGWRSPYRLGSVRPWRPAAVAEPAAA